VKEEHECRKSLTLYPCDMAIIIQKTCYRPIKSTAFLQHPQKNSPDNSTE